MKTKVALIVPSMRGGGAEKVIANLVRYINKDEFEVKLILVKKEGPYLELIPSEVGIVDLNSNRVRYSLIRMTKEINKFKPDVILSTLGHLNLAILIIKRFFTNKPKIIVRHSIAPTVSMDKLSPLKRFVQKKLYTTLYNKADVVLAQCNDMKKNIVEVFKIKPSLVEFIYNPLDLDSITEKMTDENPYDSKNINIISVGRLTEQKGFDVLINSVKLLEKKLPKLHLTILGEGKLKDELVSLAKTLEIEERITFEDFKINPYPYYYNSDLFVLASRYEGFPNTLLEALACGTKVISTECENGPLEIIGDNKFGRLVDVDNYELLANEITHYLDSENKTSTRAMKFDINKIVFEYEELFKGVLQ